MIFEIPPIGNPAVTGLIGKTQSDAPALFASFFTAIVGFILTLSTIWAFVHLLIGGISWMTSGGDKSKVEIAQQHITQALVGLMIVFSSWAIFLVILQFLGLASGTGGGFQLKLPTLF